MVEEYFKEVCTVPSYVKDLVQQVTQRVKTQTKISAERRTLDSLIGDLAKKVSQIQKMNLQQNGRHSARTRETVQETERKIAPRGRNMMEEYLQGKDVLM